MRRTMRFHKLTVANKSLENQLAQKAAIVNDLRGINAEDVASAGTVHAQLQHDHRMLQAQLHELQLQYQETQSKLVELQRAKSALDEQIIAYKAKEQVAAIGSPKQSQQFGDLQSANAKLEEQLLAVQNKAAAGRGCT